MIDTLLSRMSDFIERLSLGALEGVLTWLGGWSAHESYNDKLRNHQDLDYLSPDFRGCVPCSHGCKRAHSVSSARIRSIFLTLSALRCPPLLRFLCSPVNKSCHLFLD